MKVTLPKQFTKHLAAADTQHQTVSLSRTGSLEDAADFLGSFGRGRRQIRQNQFVIRRPSALSTETVDRSRGRNDEELPVGA
jgi:hypothetical protein